MGTNVQFANTNVANGNWQTLGQYRMLGEKTLKMCTHFYIFFHKLATNMTLNADETQMPSDSNSVILLDFSQSQ